MIKKEGNKYKVLSESGDKDLGEFDAKKEALKRLSQIEYFKNKKAPSGY